MDRRRFIQATGGIATLGIAGVGTVAASGTLTNATVNSDGTIIATDDNFVIAGHDLTVNDETSSPVIYNDGYSGEIYGNTLTVNSIDEETYGVHVEGGDVDVYDNTVDAVDDLGPQFIAIGYTAGATGKASTNEITGKHRVGVLAKGAGTDVDISRNTIMGSGPTTTGWADNGIQVSYGGTATVQKNHVEDHWWNKNDYVSSGIIIYLSNKVTVQDNTVKNNDIGIPLFYGDENNVIHNTIDVTITPKTPGGDEVLHYGTYISGDDNGFRQNSITAEDGDVGIYIFAGSDRTKLIRNEFDGWDDPIVDSGDETKLPDPFVPS